MTVPRTIGILVHADDPRARSTPYLIWSVADAWRDLGIDVRVIEGPSDDVAVDALVCHVDLTVLPDAYARFVATHPCAINRGARDVSKREVSPNLVTRDADWDGPVIIKTDRNHGGYPERRTFGEPRRRSRSLAKASTVRPDRYPIHDSIRNLPAGVFDNPALVVERFLPDTDGSTFTVHCYTFFGAHEDCQRKTGKHPVVKSRDIVARCAVPVHAEIRALRNELGLDFGKLDYVVHEGTPHLIDVNPTPTGPARPLPDVSLRKAEERARALLDLCEDYGRTAQTSRSERTSSGTCSR